MGRIHWDNGPCLYGSASEAPEDIRTREYRIETSRSTAADEEPSVNQDTHWNKATSSHSKCMCEKLHEFRQEEI